MPRARGVRERVGGAGGRGEVAHAQRGQAPIVSWALHSGKKQKNSFYIRIFNIFRDFFWKGLSTDHEETKHVSQKV